jgi:CAAX protease family protein
VAAASPRSEDGPREGSGCGCCPSWCSPRSRRPYRESRDPCRGDFAEFLGSDRGEDFFRGEWGWFAVVVVLSVFNTVLGEELLWRGLLLPRMRGVFGRGDFVANGVLFALYHLHTPWVIPTTLVDIFALAYPSRRFQSAWMGIVVHSLQSIVVIIVVLTLVLG